MLLANIFPTGQYGLNEDSFSVRVGMYDIVVATRSAGVWSLTTAGATIAASNPATDVAPASNPDGTVGSAYITKVEYGKGENIRKTVLTLAAVPQAIVNTTAEYASSLIYTFPEGRILLLGATARVAQTTTTTIATSISAGATGAFALGDAVASATSLTGAMVNMLPSTAYTSSTVINTEAAYFAGALAASAQFDGTTTPKPVYFNTAIATGSIDGAQTFNGTVTLTWVHLGDY